MNVNRAPLLVCMRKGVSLISAIVVMVFLHGTACADDTAGPPDLTGTWVAVDGAIHHWHGKAVEVAKGGHQMRIEIDEQNGALLSATMIYANPPDVNAHDGSTLTTEAQEKLVGVIGWNGKTVTFVDTPDTGYQHITLVDNDTMEMIFVESGEFALAGRVILKRDASGKN